MALLQDIRRVTTGLPAREALHHLLIERFPGKVAVTATLKSPSIVVLKLVADIEPSTPVIFCQPLPEFPESKQYRAEIIKLLALTNVKVVTRSDPLTGKRDCEICERLWNERPDGAGKVRETIHLNDTLNPYKCWIKAGYHDRSANASEHRIDMYAGKVIVDILRRRTGEDIDRFMQAHGLPHHPKIRFSKTDLPVVQQEGPEIGWHF